jgi:hypothetical protein
MPHSRRIKRRRFLRTAAGIVLGVPSIIPSSSLGKDGHVAANSRIVIGCIGVGSRGFQVLGGFLNQRDAQIAAVCDVNAHRRTAALQRINAHYQSSVCRAYHDYRELIAHAGVDMVIIATPDHWHVLTA